MELIPVAAEPCGEAQNQSTRNTLPLEEQLKRAYYYDDAGKWRGSSEDCSEWDRWHAVAKIAILGLGDSR